MICPIDFTVHLPEIHARFLDAFPLEPIAAVKPRWFRITLAALANAAFLGNGIVEARPTLYIHLRFRCLMEVVWVIPV